MVTGDEVLYCDLSEDETLFEGSGDYQFEVYRQMREITWYIINCHRVNCYAAV